MMVRIQMMFLHSKRILLLIIFRKYNFTTPAGTSVRPFRQALPIGLHHLTCVIRLPLTMNAVLAMSIIGWSNRLSV